MKTQINKQGFTVVSDGRSHKRAANAGRPPKMADAAKRHIKKKYSGKVFTSKDFIQSFRLQLIGGSTSVQVKAGMLLNKLRKEGILSFEGVTDNGKRGNNEKQYRLK